MSVMVATGVTRPLATGARCDGETELDMGKAAAPLSGPLGDELAELMESEGSLADVVVTDVLSLPWPTARVVGDDVARVVGDDVPTARAGVAIRSLHDHLRHSYGTVVGLEVQSSMIDAVSDLRHLADALGLDWSYVIEMAEENYASEVG